MAISLGCEECGKEYRVKDELAGKRIKCKECEAVITIPLSEVEEIEDDEEPLEAPMRRPAKSSKGSKRGSRGGGQSGIGTLEDIFTSDKSVWWKMLGAAVATPVLLVVVMKKAQKRGGPAFDLFSPTNLALLLGSTLVGAVLGALLTTKDVVQRRMKAGDSVAFPWVLMFGKGLISLLFVWFPLVIGVTLAVTMLTLGF